MEEYYVYQPHYWQLKELGKMMRTAKTKSETLICYMQTHNLPVDSYIQLTKGIFVPIIYQCCLTPSHVDFFKWLTRNGADPHKLPDSEQGTHADHLLFCCYEGYLEILIKKCHVKLEKSRINEQIAKKLQFGNLRRIKLLIKFKALRSADLYAAIKNFGREALAFKVVSVLIDRINMLCRLEKTIKDDIDAVLVKYREIIDLISPDPTAEETVLGVKLSLLQYCANFYLDPILSVLVKNQKLGVLPKVTVTYHEDLKPELVAALRYLYNDRRYVLTCDFVNQIPDKRAF